MARRDAAAGDGSSAGDDGRLAAEVIDAVVDGLTAAADGDHARANALLDPLVDDPKLWQLVDDTGMDQVDVAYAAAMGRLLAGDPEGTSRVLGLVARAPDLPGYVRRAGAQVELSRGALDQAQAFLDTGPDAELMDRALTVTLRWRQGRSDEARHLALELVGEQSPEPAPHPWDLAGALAQAGFVLVEVGDHEGASRTVARAAALIDGAPGDLPLVSHVQLVRAGALRLAGRAVEAADAVAGLSSVLTGCERGLALLEEARQEVSSGRFELAAELYTQSQAAFDAAGERWHVQAVMAESEGLERNDPT